MRNKEKIAKLKWYARQLFFTKYATATRTSENNWQPEFVTWWMWLGNCYKIKRSVI